MKLTTQELQKINNIPSLARLCKTVIEVAEHGTDKEYCYEVLDMFIPVLRKKCRLFRLVEAK